MRIPGLKSIFPKLVSWVTFDPTPIAGRNRTSGHGFAAQAGKLCEALELIWFQYVVGYDKQEQRSLGYVSPKSAECLSPVSGSDGFLRFGKQCLPSRELWPAFGVGLVGILLLLLIAKRVRHFGWRGSLKIRPTRTVAPISTVQFYERLTRLLSRRGVERDAHLTPLEFAGSLDFQPALL